MLALSEIYGVAALRFEQKRCTGEHIMSKSRDLNASGHFSPQIDIV
jgi:hypothetical protein